MMKRKLNLDLFGKSPWIWKLIFFLQAVQWKNKQVDSKWLFYSYYFNLNTEETDSTEGWEGSFCEWEVIYIDRSTLMGTLAQQQQNFLRKQCHLRNSKNHTAASKLSELEDLLWFPQEINKANNSKWAVYIIKDLLWALKPVKILLKPK